MRDVSLLALVTDAFGGHGGIAQYNRDFLTALAAGGTVSSIIVLPRHAPERIIPNLSDQNSFGSPPPNSPPSRERVPEGATVPPSPSMGEGRGEGDAAFVSCNDLGPSCNDLGPVVTLPPAIRQKPARPGRLAYAVTALLTALRRRVDIVFCGHLYMAPLAWPIARLKGAKLVVQMHGIEAWPCPSRLRRAAAEAADLVLCVSRHTRACVLGWAALAPERVVVVPDTVADRFTPGDGRELRAALGLADKRVLLTVGRMASRERYKGHDRVIAAIPELMRQGHDVVYVIIGQGDDRGRLERLARETGVAERVWFLGAVGARQLAQAYRMADLFVMPSTGEGFGIAFLEAMASGTPALGLDAAGARDALAEGELGTALAEGDDLAAAIARFLVAPRPDPAELSRAVCTRFGPEIFQGWVGMALAEVLTAA